MTGLRLSAFRLLLLAAGAGRLSPGAPADEPPPAPRDFFEANLSVEGMT